jgi:CRISPR-associated protein Cas1
VLIDKIMSINPEKRKELKINKSTLWYQQKKIKEGKSIIVYSKTGVRLNRFNEIQGFKLNL